ncbi:hydratase, partial [Klebsiella aerogenes]|nr:hydratase [Klebsiella aerogenes]
RQLPGQENITAAQTEIGSMIYAVKPGDGSAREQAASCQRVLGGLANICQEYATKRYRSNVINWGMLPLQMKEAPDFEVGDFIYIPAIKSALKGELSDITAFVVSDHRPVRQITLYMEILTSSEQEIIIAVGLINYNKNQLTSSH